MRTLSLSPAGKQPVRIASMMAAAPGINVGSKAKDLFRGFTKSVKSVTLQSAALAVACVCAPVAFVAGAIVSAVPSPTAAAVLAVSSLTGIASLAVAFIKKGGAL